MGIILRYVMTPGPSMLAHKFTMNNIREKGLQENISFKDSGLTVCGWYCTFLIGTCKCLFSYVQQVS